MRCSWCLDIAHDGLNLQYGGVGQSCGGMIEHGHPLYIGRHEAAGDCYKETASSLENG